MERLQKIYLAYRIWLEDAKMNKNIIISVVLGVLILISVVQLVQLNSLKEKSGTVSVPVASQSSSSSSSSGGNKPVPGNLNNLPDMVGGC